MWTIGKNNLIDTDFEKNIYLLLKKYTKGQRLLSCWFSVTQLVL